MLWVLKRTVLIRRFFEHPKHMFELMDTNIIAIVRSKLVLNRLYGKRWSTRKVELKFGDIDLIKGHVSLNIIIKYAVGT